MDITYDFSDLYKGIDDFLNEIIAMLVQIGEESVEVAISKGRYENITGNLRSSIGYIIAKNGKIIKEGGFKKVAGHGVNMKRVSFIMKTGNSVNFWAKGRTGDGSEGSYEGMEYARKIISENNKGITLVVVAGMEYASYVNAKGLDVLDSAKKHVISLFKEL